MRRSYYVCHGHGGPRVNSEGIFFVNGKRSELGRARLPAQMALDPTSYLTIAETIPDLSLVVRQTAPVRISTRKSSEAGYPGTIHGSTSTCMRVSADRQKRTLALMSPCWKEIPLLVVVVRNFADVT